jgi:phosphoglycolate phosphatase-like HAD superfamily hydrolase
MPLKNNTTQLILFDIDGTLLWPKGSGRASTRLAMLEVFGTDAGLEGHDFGGKTDWYTLTELLSKQGFTADEVKRRMPDYEQAMARHLAQIISSFPVEACPGALDVVLELRRRGQPALGILTGNVSLTAPIKLRTAGFDPAWFPVCAYGSESPDRNELPFLAVKRAEKLFGRGIRPHEVMIIGDTLADIECARALGAVVVTVLTGYSPREDLIAARPDYVLDDLTSFFDGVLD